MLWKSESEGGSQSLESRRRQRQTKNESERVLSGPECKIYREQLQKYLEK